MTKPVPILPRKIFAILLALVILNGCQPAPAPSAIAHTGLLEYNHSVEQILQTVGEQHVWSFVGTQGDRLSIEFESDILSPDLTLDYAGQPLAGLTGGTYRHRGRLAEVILPASGTYALTITQVFAESGSYRLTVTTSGTSADDNPTPISTAPPTTPDATALLQTPTPVQSTPTALPRASSGSLLQPYQPVQGRITAPGEVARYTIFGEAGDVISVGARSAKSSNGLAPVVELYAPSGILLGVAESDPDANQPEALLFNTALPATGAYVVFVGDIVGLARGPFEISFGYHASLRRNLKASPPPDTPQVGVLDTPAVQDAWPLTLMAGDILSAAAVADTGSSLDPVLSLFSPSGQILYSDNDSGGGTNAALRQAVIPESGDYLLAVSPNSPGLGQYTLIWRYEARANP